MSLTEKARVAAHTYINCINTKNLDGLLAIFSDDAELVHPFGVFSGKQKLVEFYGGLIMHADTKLSVGRESAENSVCCVEVVGISPQAPDRPQYAIDLFEVNAEGLVKNLSIYYRNFDLK
jgi:hypothetical protein